jgi:hypothetical protein
MVIGRILGMAGKALAKKFLGKPLKTFKEVDKITPHFKKKLGVGAIGGGLGGGYLSKKHKKKKD